MDYTCRLIKKTHKSTTVLTYFPAKHFKQAIAVGQRKIENYLPRPKHAQFYVQVSTGGKWLTIDPDTFETIRG